MAQTSFNRGVATLRKAIVNRLRKNGSVSAVDLANVARSFEGPARGAVVRAAFQQLVSEGIARRTTRTALNSATRSRVSVYTRGRKFPK